MQKEKFTKKHFFPAYKAVLLLFGYQSLEKTITA